MRNNDSAGGGFALGNCCFCYCDPTGFVGPVTVYLFNPVEPTPPLTVAPAPIPCWDQCAAACFAAIEDGPFGSHYDDPDVGCYCPRQVLGFDYINDCVIDYHFGFGDATSIDAIQLGSCKNNNHDGMTRVVLLDADKINGVLAAADAATPASISDKYSDFTAFDGLYFYGCTFYQIAGPEYRMYVWTTDRNGDDFSLAFDMPYPTNPSIGWLTRPAPYSNLNVMFDHVYTFHGTPSYSGAGGEVRVDGTVDISIDAVSDEPGYAPFPFESATFAVARIKGVTFVLADYGFGRLYVIDGSTMTQLTLVLTNEDAGIQCGYLPISMGYDKQEDAIAVLWQRGEIDFLVTYIRDEVIAGNLLGSFNHNVVDLYLVSAVLGAFEDCERTLGYPGGFFTTAAWATSIPGCLPPPVSQDVICSRNTLPLGGCECFCGAANIFGAGCDPCDDKACECPDGLILHGATTVVIGVSGIPAGDDILITCECDGTNQHIEQYSLLENANGVFVLTPVLDLGIYGSCPSDCCPAGKHAFQWGTGAAGDGVLIFKKTVTLCAGGYTYEEEHYLAMITCCIECHPSTHGVDGESLHDGTMVLSGPDFWFLVRWRENGGDWTNEDLVNDIWPPALACEKTCNITTSECGDFNLMYPNSLACEVKWPKFVKVVDGGCESIEGDHCLGDYAGRITIGVSGPECVSA